MNNTTRRSAVLPIILALLLSVLTVLTPLDAAAESTLSTNKTTYVEGEDILVTATGSGYDWVGLYAASDPVPGGGETSIYWYYTSRDGNTSGNVKSIRHSEYANNRGAYLDIPAGDYIIYLCANDGYQVLAQVNITVIPDTDADTAPEAPASAVYTSAGAGAGRADGTLTVTQGEGIDPVSYTAYWGDANGRLEGWSAAVSFARTGTTTTASLAANTLVPTGADRLLVYAKGRYVESETCAVAMLPEGASDFDPGELLAELQVMSDIHLNSLNTHLHNQHFAAALEDIKTLSPDSIGLFINGDIADHGQKSEYSAFQRLLTAAGEGIPEVYAAIGNHDFAGGADAAGQIQRFLEGTGNESETIWFDRWIGGYHFIFLGSEAGGLYAELSRKQLNWLKEALEEDRVEGRPTFVFLHQGLMDTVAGTFAYQDWHGVNQSAELRRILKQYPEVVLFSGHSHWTLESEMTIKPADEELPTIVSTASCAYLWDDSCMATNVGITGSEGYYLYLYENYLILRGRSYDRGEWIGSAQFVVTLPERGETPVDTDTEISAETVPDTIPETVPDTIPETVPETIPATIPETIPETVPGTIPETVSEAATETAAPATTPETAYAETVETTVPAATTATATAADTTAGATAASSEDGCASVCGAAGTLLLLCGAAITVCRKRGKE